MKRRFTYNDVPLEVFEVWAIQTAGQPVGMSTWDYCDAIIKKYPEWFPWEHKYDKIPKRVHEAYCKELMEPQPVEQESGLPVTVQQIKESPVSFTEMISCLFKSEQKRRESQQRERKRRKSIWDRHYKKYKLEFRD